MDGLVNLPAPHWHHTDLINSGTHSSYLVAAGCVGRVDIPRPHFLIARQIVGDISQTAGPQLTHTRGKSTIYKSHHETPPKYNLQRWASPGTGALPKVTRSGAAQRRASSLALSLIRALSRFSFQAVSATAFIRGSILTSMPTATVAF